MVLVSIQDLKKIFIFMCLVSIHKDLKIRGFSRVELANLLRPGSFYFANYPQIARCYKQLKTIYNTIYATALHTYLKHIQYKQMYKMCVLYIVSYKFPPHWTMLKRPSTVHPPSLLALKQSTQLTPRKYFRLHYNSDASWEKTF